MTEKQALKLAVECITEQAKLIAERANRYHMEPEKWPGYEKDYRTYQRYIAAMRVIEDRIMGQGKLL